MMKVLLLTGLLWLVENSMGLRNPTFSKSGVEEIALQAKVMDSVKTRVKLWAVPVSKGTEKARFTNTSHSKYHNLHFHRLQHLVEEEEKGNSEVIEYRLCKLGSLCLRTQFRTFISSICSLVLGTKKSQSRSEWQAHKEQGKSSCPLNR